MDFRRQYNNHIRSVTTASAVIKIYPALSLVIILYILMVHYVRLQTFLEISQAGTNGLCLDTLSNNVPILLYLYRARNNITQLSIPTHAQLRHRLKFIKNHLKNSYMFRSSTIFRELQCPR